MIVVGFGHKARQGKDHLARSVHRWLEQGKVKVCTLALADELKSMARTLGMVSKNPVMLQHLGMAMRAHDPAYWITRLAIRVEELLPDVLLIPDVRFRNEAEWVKNQGGRLVKVTRLINADIYTAGDRDPYHPSETDLDGYAGWHRHIVVANGDVAALEQHGRFLGSEIEFALSMMQGRPHHTPTEEEDV